METTRHLNQFSVLVGVVKPKKDTFVLQVLRLDGELMKLSLWLQSLKANAKLNSAASSRVGPIKLSQCEIRGFAG